MSDEGVLDALLSLCPQERQLAFLQDAGKFSKQMIATGKAIRKMLLGRQLCESCLRELVRSLRFVLAT